ncbi:single-stranded DNA-binding protein [Candidatus Uhrbacteria bacterium]|nr:single-stranded DNA-binding protein [Candidatus Uhrbacteria bacterium]
MKSVNKVILLGHVTRDPELKNIPSGQAVCSFGFATNKVWKDKTGEKKDAVEFHNLIAWGTLAESCAKHVKKGAALYIEGYLKTHSWEGADKKKLFRTEIVIDELSFVGSHDDAEAEIEVASKASRKVPVAA